MKMVTRLNSTFIWCTLWLDLTPLTARFRWKFSPFFHRFTSIWRLKCIWIVTSMWLLKLDFYSNLKWKKMSNSIVYNEWNLACDEMDFSILIWPEFVIQFMNSVRFGIDFGIKCYIFGILITEMHRRNYKSTWFTLIFYLYHH